MREIEFKVPRGCDLVRAERVIEGIVEERGLEIHSKGTLASFRGSTHWHCKKHGQTGTLELTLNVPDGRVWAQGQDGRRAAWIEKELPGLKREIEKQLRRRARDQPA